MSVDHMCLSTQEQVQRVLSKPCPFYIYSYIYVYFCFILLRLHKASNTLSLTFESNNLFDHANFKFKAKIFLKERKKERKMGTEHGHPWQHRLLAVPRPSLWKLVLGELGQCVREQTARQGSDPRWGSCKQPA